MQFECAQARARLVGRARFGCVALAERPSDEQPRVGGLDQQDDIGLSPAGEEAQRSAGERRPCRAVDRDRLAKHEFAVVAEHIAQRLAHAIGDQACRSEWDARAWNET